MHLLLQGEPQPLALLEVASSPATRSRGLLGRDGLAPCTGLLITPCRCVHTWFMRFAIDVVFLDRGDRVVRIASNVTPFRLVWGGWRARATIELSAGDAARMGLRVGSALSLARARED